MNIKNIDNVPFKKVCSLYNKILPNDTLSDAFIKNKTFEDPDFNPEMNLFAEVDGELVGFMFGVARKTDDGIQGGIKAFGVDGKHRNKGIATALLNELETRMFKNDCKSVTIGFTRPNYITAGIDPRLYTVGTAFLIRRGYQKIGDVFNMDVELDDSDWSTADCEKELAKDGITVRRLPKEDIEKFRSWMNKDGYSSGWQYQVMTAAQQEPVAVFVAEKDNDYLAFACYDGVRPGWFGPMGTSGQLRGKGIGTVTYLKCLQSMKELGYKTCVINAVGPLYFYSKVSNAVVNRIFWRMNKNLEQPVDL
ncbi:MAG: GNAT family N-acetyltransferase [Armatimonadota bacterium]